MRRNEALQVDVLDELAFDPEVDSSDIAVTVTDEDVVTLNGRVPTYEQLHAAERAVRRVKRVKAVANDLSVRVVPASMGPDDTAIAEAAKWVLRCSPVTPEDEVVVMVTNGWVTLEGRVADGERSRAIADVVRGVPGVRGIGNRMVVGAPAESADSAEPIEAAVV